MVYGHQFNQNCTNREMSRVLSLRTDELRGTPILGIKLDTTSPVEEEAVLEKGTAYQ